MLRLTTLGATDLRDRLGHPIREVLAQPKRVALLVYLAVEGAKGPLSRDRLLAAFWPEADEAHARNALSQSLHHLRQALGTDVIESQGAAVVGVCGERLWCDATEFAGALGRGEAELALDLYRGEFCPTLFVSGTPEVERWLDTQRRRLRGQALTAARALAERLEARGDADGVARVARRALAIHHDDEVAVRSLLVLLDRAGDNAGALAAYEEHVARLTTELEVEPSPELSRVGEELRARAAAAAAVATENWGPPPVLAVPGAPRQPVAAGARRWPLPVAATVAAALVLVAGVAALVRLGLRPADPKPNPDLIVVAPFRLATSDSTLAFLGEGMVDLLAARLGGTGRLRTVDPRSVLAAWRAGAGGRDADRGLTLARRLGAGWLASGAAVGTPHQLVVAVTLVDVATGQSRFEARAAGTLDSLGALVDALTLRMLPTLAAEPSPRVVALSRTPMPALRAYLDGRSAYRGGRFEEAVQHLRDAVALDTTFAVAALELAYSAEFVAEGRAPYVAHAWWLRDQFSAGDRAILAAIAGPRYPETSTLTEVTDAWQRATRAAPEAPGAWYDYGDFLFHAGAATKRDTGFVRAEAALRRAAELDSSEVRALVHLSQIALQRGDVTAARRLGDLVFARDSTTEEAQFLRWRLAVASGDSVTSDRIESALDTLPLGTVRRLVDWSQADGLRPGIALRALAIFQRRAATAEDASLGTRLLLTTTTNAGRFAPWRAYLRATSPRTTESALEIAPYAWFDGSRTVALTTARGASADARWLLVLGDCERGKRAACADLPRAVEPLMRKPPSVSREIIEVLTAAALGRPDAESLLASREAARDMRSYGDYASLTLIEGRAWAMLGQPSRALEALRRRPYGTAEANTYLAPSLHLEGRLAAQLGDTAGAIRAYQHYLALRPDPDPDVRAIVDSVRQILAGLSRRHE